MAQSDANHCSSIGAWRGVLCQALGVSQKLDVAWMLADVLQKDRAFLYTYPERVLDEVQWRRYTSMLAKRASGQPLAYVLGHMAFGARF